MGREARHGKREPTISWASFEIWDSSFSPIPNFTRTLVPGMQEESIDLTENCILKS